MSKHGAAKYVAPVLLIPVALPILFLALIGGHASQPLDTCSSGAGAETTMTVADEQLDAEQMSVAIQIVAAVRAFGPSANKPRAAVIAVATARQESGIRNLDYGDRDSLGAFQQRPSQGWGTPEQVRNVAHATTSFVQHLVQVPGWETMRVTDAAATVQRPAEKYRGLYEQWVPLSTGLTKRLWPSATAALASATSSSVCDPILLASAGSVGYPVPANLTGTNQNNWGADGSQWASWHTGTDFSVPCGTPVLAATTGTIEVDPAESWAGRWLVKVVTGPTTVSTWYGHMRKLTVVPGQSVTAGQQIGEVGALGNATGCHLHFEVHLHNGTIYGPDNTDPTPWLANNAVVALTRFWTLHPVSLNSLRNDAPIGSQAVLSHSR